MINPIGLIGVIFYPTICILIFKQIYYIIISFLNKKDSNKFKLLKQDFPFYTNHIWYFIFSISIILKKCLWDSLIANLNFNLYIFLFLILVIIWVIIFVLIKFKYLNIKNIISNIHLNYAKNPCLFFSSKISLYICIIYVNMVNCLITSEDLNIDFFYIIMTTIIFIPSFSLSINFTNMMGKLMLKFPLKTNNIQMAMAGPELVIGSAAEGAGALEEIKKTLKSIISEDLLNSLSNEEYKSLTQLFNLVGQNNRYIFTDLPKMSRVPLNRLNHCITPMGVKIDVWERVGTFENTDLNNWIKLRSEGNKKGICIYSYHTKELYEWDFKIDTLKENKILFVCTEYNGNVNFIPYDPSTKELTNKQFFIKNGDSLEPLNFRSPPLPNSSGLVLLGEKHQMKFIKIYGNNKWTTMNASYIGEGEGLDHISTVKMLPSNKRLNNSHNRFLLPNQN